MIYPAIGTMGEPIAIIGSSFGGERGASYVTIAGAQPIGAAYMEWGDSVIRLRVPELGEAGLVRVHVGGRRSNGVLFASRDAIPAAAPGGRAGIAPSISAVSPAAAPVGGAVTITGSGFGGSRGPGGGVFFTLEGRGPRGEMEAIEVSRAELGYELWTDGEIRVRVPDGAASGHVEVRTARGRSGPAPFAVSAGPGSRSFADRRSFVISYSVDIRTGGARPPNALHLWVPFPAESAAQRNPEMLFSSPEPFIRDYLGTVLYRLDDLGAHAFAGVSLSWAVDALGVRTSVRPQDIGPPSPSPARDANLAACPRLPADDPLIRGLAASIAGAEPNPYLRARMIYDWMLSGVEWVGRARGDELGAAAERRADPFLGALLYASLLRASGVPARPVAGVIVSRDRQAASHHWAEFWIDGLGWIPADPAMGAGAVPEAFAWPWDPPDGPGPGGAAGFFFGNLDSRRIAFSRGFTEIRQMDPRGLPVTHVRSYALQTLWEEAVGGLDAYFSLWGDIIVVDGG